MHERPPPRPTGPLPTPRAGFGVPRRPVVTPGQTRYARAPAPHDSSHSPTLPSRTARTGPEPSRPTAACRRVACRCPARQPTSAGPALPGRLMHSSPGREAGRLRCAPGEDPAAAHIRCVPCLCRRWELVGVDDVRGSLCESPPAARRLRTTAGRRVIMRAVIAVASSACSRFVDGRPERRPSDRLSGAAPAPPSCSNRCVGAGSMRGPRGRARAMTRAGVRGSD